MAADDSPEGAGSGAVLGWWYYAVERIPLRTYDGLGNQYTWDFPAGVAIRPTREFWTFRCPDRVVEIEFTGPLHEWDTRSRETQFMYVADILAFCVPCNPPAADGTVPDPPPIRPPPPPPEEDVMPGHPHRCWRLPDGNFLVEELASLWPTTGAQQGIGPDGLPVPGEFLYWEFSPAGKRLCFFGRPSHGSDEDFSNYVCGIRLVWEGKLCRYDWAERYGPGRPWKNLSLRAVEREGLTVCPPDQWPETFTR